MKNPPAAPAGILLDYEPAKLSVFSNELLTRAIRVSDTLLNDFVDRFFRQAFEVFCGSLKQFDEMLREAHQLTTALAQPANWVRGLFPSWGPAGTFSNPSNPPTAPAPDTNAASLEVRKEIAALRKELSRIKTPKRHGPPSAKRNRPPAKVRHHGGHKVFHLQF